MNKLKINTLSIFALAFLSATSLSAAGVADSKDELETPTRGDYAYYTLTEATSSSYDIVKYVTNDDGSLTAVYYTYSTGTTTSSRIDNNTTVTTIASVNQDFVNMDGEATGVAIYNSGSIGSITGDFIDNSFAQSDSSKATNGVLANTTANGYIGSITGDFIGNYSASAKNVNGGFIYNNNAVIELITGDFIGNYARSSGSGIRATGGAIWNNTGTITAIEGSFINNYAYSSNANGYAVGGAVVNSASSTIGFLAKNTSTEFTGNFTRDGTVYSSNAIANLGTVNFNAYNGNTITVNDGINNMATDETIVVANKGVININGAVYSSTDSTTNLYEGLNASTVIFNNTVQGQDITVHAGTLELGSYAGGLEFNTTSYNYIDVGVAVSYTTDASVASLVNSTIAVNDGATLSITSAGVSFDSRSSLTLSDGATLILDAASSMIFNSASSLAISVSEGDFSITFNVGADSSITFGEDTYDVYAFLNDAGNLATLFNTDESNIDLTTALNSDLISTFSLESDEISEDYLLTLSGTLSGGVYSISVTTAAVPEPSTYAMIFGVIALGFAAYRRRK